jgi:hypothetical protein
MNKREQKTGRKLPSPTARLKRMAFAAGVVYAGVYFWLTLRGIYTVAVWSSGGVKAYRWLPRGFGDTRWGDDVTLNVVFAPFYYLDLFIWHTSDRGFSGKYPREPAPRFIYPPRRTKDA